ncbi:FUSC family protein [Oryzifoliimicrobium ureilyticus]|uniref:FUSC family protein n=1 Tax=Oryzifoliimicrobium ureilyticus TaxID=3113724 RepID=UPI0030763AEE
MITETQTRDIAFVLRCSGAATVGYLVAQTAGLPHPVWAAMSGIIVSQEKLGDTRQATIGRFIGTLLGVSIAVMIGTLFDRIGTDVAVDIAVAVALAAVAARRYPWIRVCMWTCPIVFLTATPGVPLWEVGASRGAEVLLGGIVGAVLHFVAECVVGWIHPRGQW